MFEFLVVLLLVLIVLSIPSARGMLSRLIGVTGYFLGVVILVVAVILILIALLS
tara:strand:- start:255 stop:416 length:162 start_codon:yes stop_codon:yes gene_type:complete